MKRYPTKKYRAAYQNALDDLETAKAYLIRAKASDEALEMLRQLQAKVRNEVEFLYLLPASNAA